MEGVEQDEQELIATGEIGMMVAVIPMLEPDGGFMSQAQYWWHRLARSDDRSQINEYGTFPLCEGSDAAYNALRVPSMTFATYVFQIEQGKWALVKTVSSPDSDPTDPVVVDVLRSIRLLDSAQE